MDIRGYGLGYVVGGNIHNYKDVPKDLKRAISNWNVRNNLAFSINFSDIINGFCFEDQSLKASHTIITEFDKFNSPVHRQPLFLQPTWR